MAGSVFLRPAAHHTCSRLGSGRRQRLLVSHGLHIRGVGWHTRPQHHPVAPPTSTNLVLPVSIHPASLSPLVTSSFLTHLPPASSLTTTFTGDETGAMEQERREPCIASITSQLSPRENLALKVLVSHQTPPFSTKSHREMFFSPHLLS